MKLNFVKMNPTENMTILILDQLPRSIHGEIAKKVMDYNNIHGEQVAFIEKPETYRSEALSRLQMMGGEFCGNASRALAAFLVSRGHYNSDYFKKNLTLSSEIEVEVPLEVSGSNDLVYCKVNSTSNSNEYISSISMPIQKNIKDFVFNENGKNIFSTLVEFDGITHIVVDSADVSSKENVFYIIKDLIKDFNYECIGIMFYDNSKSFLEPLVYVKTTDTLIWERGCGSGSCAVAIALSYRVKKSLSIDIKQPGGVVEVKTFWNGYEVEEVILKGSVKIAAEGILYLD